MNEKTKHQLMRQRELLKGYHASDVGWEESDETQKFAQPPLFLDKGGEKISLPPYEQTALKSYSITQLFENRKSVRAYRDEDVTLDQLSYLLWATQGVKKIVGRQKKAGFRTVPSAGCRHAFETYLIINRVAGLKPGIYHYVASEHQIECLTQEIDHELLLEAVESQKFAAEAPVVFVWTAVPYRMEWRYVQKATKYLMVDAGYVCENLYLAAEAVGCGVCAIGAYNQDAMDELLFLPCGPSAEETYECAVLAASVGIS
ncbi:MAG: SagB/ThcOx family dehydrogenase [Lachnospiraceae bacterium]|nr:SagB/ThcOx family dehydrogenase [Robinsoniella sp.]MDY3766829.1 SagB/ThcOx family dehydrogenase [Lachnospiraceae bacterium]